SLTHPKPDIETPAAVDFTRMPPGTAGGSTIGRAALAAAIGELEAGAGEVGGNNAGPFVRKYLQVVDVDEGNSWCAAFVSWCYLQGCGGVVGRMPFPCCPGARGLLK